MKLSFEQLLQAPNVLALSLETSGTNYVKDRCLVASFYNDSFFGSIDFNDYSAEQLLEFFTAFLTPRSIIYHDSKLTMHFLWKYFKGKIYETTFADTLLMAKLMDSTIGMDVESLAVKILGLDSTLRYEGIKQALFKKQHQDDLYAAMAYDIREAKNEERARNIFKIYEHLKANLYSTSLYALEKEFSKRILVVETNGVKVDKSYLTTLGVTLCETADIYVRKYPEIAKLGSSEQVANHIQTTWPDIPLLKQTSTGKASADSDVLESLAQKYTGQAIAEFCKDVLTYRHTTHTYSTFAVGLVTKLDENDRLHGTFNTMGTTQGRLSAEQPNLQQVQDDEEIRGAFIGNLTVADYSQMEAILWVYFIQDPELLDAVVHDIDIYTFLAARLYHMTLEEVQKELWRRKKCKTLFLAKLYGMGRALFMARSGDIPPDIIESVFKGVKVMSDIMTNFITTHGYAETYYGRRRYLKLHQAYIGVNTFIQGTAADILKRAVNRMSWEVLEKLRLLVHDELVFEDMTNDNRFEMLEDMTADQRLLKVGVGVGQSWWKAKKAAHTWKWVNGIFIKMP